MNCRFCHNELRHPFIDLVNSPPSNSYLTLEQLNEPETYYPLKVFVCDSCFLVQIDEYKKSADIFNQDYAYFSSYSTAWLDHSRRYAHMIIERLNLDKNSIVMEIASNDGYLLQYFVEKEIPCYGIEPAENAANVAREKGITVLRSFFGNKMAHTLTKADLIIGNNVLAHVPDINSFVDGLRIALKPEGTITMEFPHILNLINECQFDTIYHEHYSYLSLLTVDKIFRSNNLKIYDVEELPTHGGSLRIYATHADSKIPYSKAVTDILAKEMGKKLNTLEGYLGLQSHANRIRLQFLGWITEVHGRKDTIAAYGAAAKGNTFLNYCGIKGDMIQFIVDKSPHKQGKYLPGSHIPIVGIERIKEVKPRYILILPWNIRDEIMAELSFVRSWYGIFVTAIPRLKLI